MRYHFLVPNIVKNTKFANIFYTKNTKLVTLGHKKRCDQKLYKKSPEKQHSLVTTLQEQERSISVNISQIGNNKFIFNAFAISLSLQVFLTAFSFSSYFLFHIL